MAEKSPIDSVSLKPISSDKSPVIQSTEQTDVQNGIIIEDGLRRGLLGRHVTLISLASVIGASCFYGFGYALFLAGPLGALIGFSIIGKLLEKHWYTEYMLSDLGFMVWALMQSIGEVTTMFPIAGGFIEHASRFVDPAFSFAMAWMYYFMWSVFLGSEWNGAILILQYWVSEETLPMWGWVLIFWGFFSVLSTLGIVVYGELEYYLGWFKIFSLGACFFISFLVNVGAFGGGYIGFRYWTPPQGPVVNGINGFGQVFVLASAYYVGTEIISLAAGETKDPRRSIPQGVNAVVYRILFVYLGLIFFQGLICPSDSPDLLNAASTVASSPFTIGFTAAGWKSSGHFINALIMVAFISAGNGCIYVQSRALYSLALTGRAPRFFAITSKKGVPYVSILTSCTWGLLALMNLKVTAGKVFEYLVSVGGSAAYIAWAAIIFTHLRVRSGMLSQGIEPSTYPFKAFGSIWIYRFNLFLNIFILLIQGFTSFEHPFNWRTFLASYITIPATLLLFVGYKVWYKTHWMRLSEMDFSDRLLKLDEEVEEEKEPSLVSQLFSRFRN
ncbi:general amino acid permease [Hyphodiscus hymeniophilus]|uniref:General amino acid permease n=1 Tax=Hyphodiscus hymeniophilus TaxID=353542 RepID=A0A9P6VQ83_9HELO|nr:general amino acid permease [Hyphodiscus hymeniophilus]